MPLDKNAPAGKQGASANIHENYAIIPDNTQGKPIDSALKQYNISNKEFLEGIYGKVAGHLWICSFVESPDEMLRWGGKVYRLGEELELSGFHNNYFSVAELSSQRRIKANFSRMAVLVLDDADPSGLPIQPSYAIETSPDKHQIGYILNDTPEARDPEYCALALNNLVARGLVNADKSGNNIVRYVRLPVGTNTKKRDTGLFQHILRIWEPSRRYTLPEVLAAFGISQSNDSIAFDTGLGSQNDGKFDIRQAIEEILTGSSFHDNLIRFAARYAAKGIPRDDIISTLMAAMDASSVKESDPERWQARVAEIPRAVDSAIAKYSSEFSDITKPLHSHPEPLNLFADTFGTSPEWSAADYPDIIAHLAADVSRRMGVDPVIPAWTAIAAATALIDDQYKLQIKAHDTEWRESARLWIAFVGDPSTKKSPAMSAVLAPLKRLQAEWHQEYTMQLKTWEKQTAEAKKNKLPSPDRPHPRKAYVNDTTLEALADILEHNNGGVLAVHDELSGWFGSMDCYRQNGVSKDRPAWLTAYNGGNHFVDRVGSGPKFIPNFSVGIVGGIQPDPMRRISSRLGDDDGLLQRFITLPVKPAMCGDDIAPDNIAQDAWEAMCRGLPDIYAPNPIRLSPEAQKILDDARYKIQALGQNPAFDKRLQSALQKGEGQLARLALVFHFVENREDTDLLGPCPGNQVVGSTATKVARLFLHFVIPNMIRFYHDVIADSDDMALVRLAAGFILTHGKDRVNARDLYRAHRELRGKVNQNALASAMSQLELAGWVSPEPKTAGKTPTAWRVNPRVHIEFSELARKERERRTAIRTNIQEFAKMSRLSLEDSLGI